MIHSYVFDQGKLIAQNMDLDALRLARSDPGLHVWVDLERPTDAEVKAVLEGVFSFHPLAIEDCVMVSHMPKLEDYETYLFMVLHSVDFSRQEQFSTTELDIFLGREFLVTYHTQPLRTLSSIRERIRQNPGTIARSPDRLLHAIMDLVIDYYKPTLEELGEEVQELEDSIFDMQTANLVKPILQVRKEINYFRSIIRPQGALIASLSRGENKIIRAAMLPYFRNISDLVHRYDTVAMGFADQLLVTMDVYLNKAQSETNNAIKTLTIITALTTPVTVLGSWYGMNFEHIPELHWPFAYGGIFLVTLITTVVWGIWMKRAGWF